MLLVALDAVQTIDDMDIPGFRLHPLKGKEKGRWSVWVNGNWRVTGDFNTVGYLEPNGITGRELASKLGVSASTLNRVVTGKSGISPEMALSLSRHLGRSQESWLAMQRNSDLWQAKRRVNLGDVERLKGNAA